LFDDGPDDESGSDDGDDDDDNYGEAPNKRQHRVTSSPASVAGADDSLAEDAPVDDGEIWRFGGGRLEAEDVYIDMPVCCYFSVQDGWLNNAVVKEIEVGSATQQTLYTVKYGTERDWYEGTPLSNMCRRRK
jgi:hypothetical protein